MKLSVVMPCLNEADTIECCIMKAHQALRENSIDGEVVVADNGSTDGSIAIAERCGARVVHVARKGYGNALMGGIEAAHGTWVLMGDADDSYDFRELPRFCEKLTNGYDLVQGCRLPGGGGRIEPGAMPALHRYIGNPLLSFLGRAMFRTRVSDIYCGMRAFTAALYSRLGLQCTGMEFATEMIIKAALLHEKTTEVPITLHPDGRKTHAPHLRTFRDGWRTIRLFLLYSPRWLFLAPGMFLAATGILGYCLALPGISLSGITFDAHTLLFASLFVLMGYQSILFSVFSKTYGMNSGLLPPDRRMETFFRHVDLEKGVAASVLLFTAGCLLLSLAILRWYHSGWGDLDYPSTMRIVVPGVTLTALGFQTALSSFFVSILGMHRRRV